MNLPLKIVTALSISCVVCLFLVFALRIQAQGKTKAEFIATKPEMNSVKKPEVDSANRQATIKMKEQAEAQRNRFRERQQNRGKIDFGENAAFYRVIIDNNLFRPLGWTPPNNEPAYSLVGTAVNSNGTISQATLLEKRSDQYHFVTVGTKLGDMTVKDIQPKQVTLDKAGEMITLKASAVQFLTTNRHRSDGKDVRARSGQSEKEGNNPGQNRANAKQLADEKRKQMEQQKQAAALRTNREMVEKLKDASPEERRKIMQDFRRQARNRRGGNRR